MQKIFFFISLIISQFAFSQEIEGKICGKVLDNTGQPAPYAAVMLMQGETVVNGAYTDENGVYCIQPVEIGIYDLKVQVLEAVQMVTGVEVKECEERWLEVAFMQKIEDTEGVSIIHVRRPPFNKESKPGILLNGEDLQKMADRRLSAPASLATGVYVPIK